MSKFGKMVNHIPDPPKGFYEVVGHEPFAIGNDKPRTTSTFAVRESAERWQAEHGGEVRHRDADFILD